MKVISLQSGSNGNCIYVEADGVRLLFDAGISGMQAQERLARHGRQATGIDALLISHEHSDHARGMGVFHRKFGVPVHVTEETHRAAGRHRLGEIRHLVHFRAGESLRFGRVVVETYSTPHDSVDGVVFVVDDGRHRLGILTDLGHVFSDLAPLIASLDAVLLESNYDPDMLARGDYPEWLKERIAGFGGHISNFESAELLRDAAPRHLKWACLGHLSQHNNTPELALQTHRRVLGDRLPLFVATRHEASPVMELR
jgi:phosphoribosyl 1,2-cyclic phosphodiesterase